MKLDERLERIRAETDQNRKNLLAAEIVSALFRAVGSDPVIVGGSAVEFYTDGAYVSGDVDVCFAGARLPTPWERETILAPVGESVSIRAWNIGGVFVDLLGRLETSARSDLQTLGDLRLIQIEDLIAERILVATQPRFNKDRWQVAKTLLAMAWNNLVSIDRGELTRVANSRDYRVGEELRQLIEEVEATRTQSSEPAP